jgi:hypothetical protein
MATAVFKAQTPPARRSTPGMPLLDVILLLCRQEIRPAERLFWNSLGAGSSEKKTS